MWAVGLALVLLVPVSAYATVLDLATSSDDITPDTTSGTINGAIFQWTNFHATGTGLIDTFVQLQHNSTEHAYNTTENGTLDNGSSDQFSHALALADIPVMNFGGVDYYEFLLDINEPSANSKPYLTLNEIQVIQSDTLNPDSEIFSGGLLQIPGGSLVYRLTSATHANSIELNASLNTGSGSGDMYMYIPTSVFSNSYQYVYLYSAFGNPNGSDAGFEEWAVRLTPDSNVVPEPASLSLVGLGLAGMVARKLRKRS
jgi:hypothetical protein